MDSFFNFPLYSGLIAIGFAQFVKVPLVYITTKKVDWRMLTSTGGMPSSHSAAVTALATAIALEHGFSSPLFAICAIFGVIVMFDATGICRHAGYHATVLNQLVTDFQRLVKEMKAWPDKEEQEKRKELKELLGHQPIEVFFGGVVGILISLIFYFILN